MQKAVCRCCLRLGSPLFNRHMLVIHTLSYVNPTYVVRWLYYKQLSADVYEAALDVLAACARALPSSCLQRMRCLLYDVRAVF